MPELDSQMTGTGGESMSARILIAGIGNIFFGDDAFGVEVARDLAQRGWPDGVRVVDFGTRSYDLAYALTETYQAVILVDAVPRGEPPGTTYLMELDPGELPKLDAEIPDAHNLTPVRALQMAQALGGVRAKLFLVGCEPAVLETEDGQLKLSEPVQAAVPQAELVIAELISDLLHSNELTECRSL